MKVRWLAVVMGGSLIALTGGCRLGASARLHEEPTRIDVVYCEAAPITVVAPSTEVAVQATRSDDEEAR